MLNYVFIIVNDIFAIAMIVRCLTNRFNWLVKRIKRRVAIVHNSVILSIERAGVRAPTR